MILNPVIAGKSLPDIANPGTAADLLTGKQLIGPDGEVISGSMPKVKLARPLLEIDSTGTVIATVEQPGGKVDGGTTTGTLDLTTQGGKTVTPGTSQQTAVYSGRYTTGNVYVAGDSDLKPENIKSGVNIFGVAGTMTSGPSTFGSRAIRQNSSKRNEITFSGLPTTYMPVAFSLTHAFVSSSGSSGDGPWGDIAPNQIMAATFFWDGMDYVCRSAITKDSSSVVYWCTLLNDITVSYVKSSGVCSISSSTYRFDYDAYILSYATQS